MPRTIRLAGKHTSSGGRPPFPRVRPSQTSRPDVVVPQSMVARGRPADGTAAFGLLLDVTSAHRHCGKWHVPLPMPYETILYDVSDAGVATITLNQPDTRNALSNELLGELIDAFETAKHDDKVRCVVLASSHDRVFSSGANLGGFAGEVPLVHKHFGSDRFVKLFRLIGELGKPSICAAGGHVLAGSLGIALACDLVIAKEGAEFGTPEINVGAFPFMIMALIYRNV